MSEKEGWLGGVVEDEQFFILIGLLIKCGIEVCMPIRAVIGGANDADFRKGGRCAGISAGSNEKEEEELNVFHRGKSLPKRKPYLQ